jgi:polyisoprenoid-binding protein YceI
MTRKLIYASMVMTSAIIASSFTPLTNNLKPGITATISPDIAQAATKWTIDKAHSNVKFTVTHMVVTETEGSFKIFDGSMEHTKPDYSDAKVEFTVDVNSIDTDNDNRDKHLKSDDFFNAEKYPAL